VADFAGVEKVMDIHKRGNEILTEVATVISQVDQAQFDMCAQAICQANRIFVAGAGRSGLLMKAFAMRLMQTGLQTYFVGDSTTPSIGGGRFVDMLIVASGSGSTSTMIPLVEKARERGVAVLLITYSLESPIATQTNLRLCLPVPTDDTRPGGVGGTQILGSLFDESLLVAGTLLIEDVARQLAQDDRQMQMRHANLE